MNTGSLRGPGFFASEGWGRPASLEVYCGKIVGAYLSSLPQCCKQVSDLERHRTGSFAADALEQVELGNAVCVLIAEGVGSRNHPRSELTYSSKEINLEGRESPGYCGRREASLSAYPRPDRPV